MDNFKHNLNDLLQKPIDRRQFLKLSGIALLSLIGMGRILHVLKFAGSNEHSGSEGYSHIPYGSPKG
jgi:hypothetical protein